MGKTNYEEVLTLAEAKVFRDELEELVPKAELGFKISSASIAIAIASIALSGLSESLADAGVHLYLLSVAAATILGGFKRLFNAMLSFVLKGLQLIPIFPINLLMGLWAFAIIIVCYLLCPVAFFRRMRKNIAEELEIVDSYIRECEN